MCDINTVYSYISCDDLNLDIIYNEEYAEFIAQNIADNWTFIEADRWLRTIYHIVPIDRYNDPINPPTRQHIRAYP